MRDLKNYEFLDRPHFIPLSNKYESAEVLEGWLKEIRDNIENEIGFSKSSF